jgi:iron complex transport system ATP-binding protein
MTGAHLEAEGLVLAIRKQELISGVSVDFPPGSFTAVLGPNGAGKSTLLRLLCGALRPTRGSVQLDGDPLAAIPRPRIARLLSFLPQNSGSSLDVTVWDTVSMGRLPYRRSWQTMSSRDLEVVHDALERVDIRHLSRRTLPTLSGGEMQRVFLARALAQEASILLLDEPTHSLDVRHELDLMELLGGLHRDGKTIVVAMHDLDLVWEAVPDCILLHTGRTIAVGPTREILLSPETARVFGVEIAESAGGIRCRRTGAVPG